MTGNRPADARATPARPGLARILLAAVGIGFGLLTLVALATVASLYMSGSAVAGASLGAMTLRTVVWLALFVAMVRITRAMRAR